MLPEPVMGTFAGCAGGLAGTFVPTAALTADAEGWGVLGAAILGTVLGYTGRAALGAGFEAITAGSLLGVEGGYGLCYCVSWAGQEGPV